MMAWMLTSVTCAILQYAYVLLLSRLRVARLVLHAGKLDFLLLQKKVTSSKAKALQKVRCNSSNVPQLALEAR